MMASLSISGPWFWGLIGFSVFSLLASVVFAAWFVGRLPADYFATGERHHVLKVSSKGSRILLLIVKNLLGGLLVVLGIVLSVPGIPGQGLITILAGLVIMDFPGKFRLERSIAKRRPVRAVLNWLRARQGRPPLTFPH